MLEELGIKDDSLFPNFVRVEITPKGGDIWNHDINNWKLRVDQDFRPDWFDVDEVEPRAKEKLKEWFEQCFVIDDKIWKEYKDTKIYVKNSKVKAFNSSVEAWGNSSVEERENSSVVERGNSSVVARGNSSVVARGNSSVVARENSSVEAWGNSSVEAWGNSSVEARENSSVEARENSSVVARGNSQIVIPQSMWYKDVKINGVHDNATVKDLHGDKPIIYVAKDSDFKMVKWRPKK
jgi:hypothetical protein